MAIRFHNANQSAIQSRYATFTLSERRKAAAYASGAITGNTLRLSNGAIAIRQWTDQRDAVYTVHGNWPACGLTQTNQYANPSSGTTLTATGIADDLTLSFDLHTGYGDSTCGVTGSWNPNAIPRVFVVNSNGSLTDIAPDIRNVTPTIRIDGNRMKQAIWTVHYNGWHVEHVLTVWHNQAVAEFQTIWLLSDETSPVWSALTPNIRFEYGYPVKLKWAANEGFVKVNANGSTGALTGSDTTIQIPMSFPDGTTANARLSYDGRTYHGRRYAVRGWMTCDSANFPLTNVNHLKGVGDYTEWDGYYLFGGKVGALPSAPGRSEIVRPHYSSTGYHMISWNRGTGGSDGIDVWSAGLVFASAGASSAVQGNLEMVGLSQCVWGYQELYDAECAVADFGLRSAAWVKRDGSYWINEPGNLCALFMMQPHEANGSTHNFFGKPNNDGFIVAGSGDGFDAEHFLTTGLYSYYQLAKDDYFAHTMCGDYLHCLQMCSRRPLPYSVSGYSMAGDREPGRTPSNGIYLGTVRVDLRAFAYSVFAADYGSSSFGQALRTNQTYRLTPPTGPGKYQNVWTTQEAYLGAEGMIGAMWNSHSLPTAYQLYLLSGIDDYRVLFEDLGVSLFKHNSINVLPGHLYYGVTLTTQPGWQLGYWHRVYRNGQVLTDAQRTSNSSVFAGFYEQPGGWIQMGGDALRGWAMGGTVTYAMMGQDAAAKERARLCAWTLTHRTLATGLPQPRGWWMSGYMAWGDLSGRAGVFGWGDGVES